jgi:hypothetical protein
MDNERFWVFEWTIVRGKVRKCYKFPGQDSLCLQVSSVRCSWGRLEVIWCSLGGPETLLWFLCLLSCNWSVITTLCESNKPMGKDWSGLFLLATKPILIQEKAMH